MHYVYILKSKKNSSLYIGRTKDIEERLQKHNAGKSPSTKRYLPWVLVYSEGYLSEEDAKEREFNLKYFGKAYAQLKRRIKNSLHSA